MRLGVTCASLAVGLFASSGAFALDDFTIGFGAMFQAGGNFLDQPSEQRLPDRDGTLTVLTPEYPGFAGVTLGGGAYIDLRFYEWVGLEFDVLYTTDRGEAELSVTQGNIAGRYDITIQQNAIHMPLLVKGIIPGEIAQPMLFVGPEFVVPVSDRELVDITPASDNPANAPPLRTANIYSAPETYIGVAFGLGVEFKLPIPKVDLRLPLTLRGFVNPGVSDERAGRENVCASPSPTPGCSDFDGGTRVSQVEYKTAWKFSAVANLGASIHF